jgi:hypothetical protein
LYRVSIYYLLGPIFEGETSLLKKDPKKWLLYDGHYRKAVNGLKEFPVIFLVAHLRDTFKKSRFEREPAFNGYSLYEVGAPLPPPGLGGVDDVANRLRG